MKVLLILSVSVLLLLSCQQEKAADKINREIGELEQLISTNPGFSKETAQSLVGKYEAYANLEEADPARKVDYLMRAGEMSSMTGDFRQSLAFYERIIREFPGDEKVPTALFMKGYTLDDKMGKLEEAKTVYEEFLNKYPGHDFADDAEFLLKNLGKSEEEIIQSFEGQGNE